MLTLETVVTIAPCIS